MFLYRLYTDCVPTEAYQLSEGLGERGVEGSGGITEWKDGRLCRDNRVEGWKALEG